MFTTLAIPYAVSVTLTVIIIILAVLLLLWLLLGLVFFFIALGSKRREDETIPQKNSLFERNKDNINLKNGYKWYDETYHQEVSAPSRDKGRRVHGVEFRNPSNSNVWVITHHGWTSCKRENSSYAMEFYRRGYNVLIPDMRGHGNSESKFVSMGWLDRLDTVDWINELVRENPNCKIVLHGVSMGGGTVMMVTGEELPENVVCAIEDCGFSGVYDIFFDQCVRKYHVPPKIVMPAAGLFNRIINGFSFKKASTIAQLQKSKTPTLFIHGDKDDFVLPENLDKVYDACPAPKEKHVIHGAEHALSSHWFHEEYWRIVYDWLDKNGV